MPISRHRCRRGSAPGTARRAGSARARRCCGASTNPRPAAPSCLIDGRFDPLAGLSLAHRLAGVAPRPPLTLFLAAAAGADSIAGLGASQLAAIIEAPLSDAALASALLAALAGDVPPAEAPPARDAVASAPAGMPLPVPARKLKILIAEDNGANRKILRRILEMRRPSDRGGQ